MSLLKNFSFVFGAQTAVLIISVVRALILPKFLSMDGFGYWEIYWFYITWCGLFCLGYNDGIYLEYGECDYNQLPIKLIRSSTRLFICMLTIFTFIAVSAIFLFTSNGDLQFALFFSALDIIVLGLTGLFIYIFQITNQFKKYSFYSIIDKVLVLVVIILLLIANEQNYKYIIVTDFLSKVLVLICMIYKGRELIIGETEDFKKSAHFMRNMMSIGMKLLVANLMSMLLVGAGKFIVQIYGNIKDFAIYSFGMSITGLVLTSVTAFSLVLYPAVKRIRVEEYSALFNKINDFTRLFGLSSILLYFPVYCLVEIIYPQYASVLIYLNILFALIFLQCKISILDNTFYKALREEQNMLIANLTCVGLFFILALAIFTCYNEIWVIALCTFIAMFYRSYRSEVYLNHKIDLSFNKQNWTEILMIGLFLLSTTVFSFTIAFVTIFTAYTIWFISRYYHHKNLLMEFLKNRH